MSLRDSARRATRGFTKHPPPSHACVRSRPRVGRDCTHTMPPPPRRRPPTAGGPGVSTPGPIEKCRDLVKIASLSKTRREMTRETVVTKQKHVTSFPALDMCVCGQSSAQTARVSTTTKTPPGRRTNSKPPRFPTMETRVVTRMMKPSGEHNTDTTHTNSSDEEITTVEVELAQDPLDANKCDNKPSKRLVDLTSIDANELGLTRISKWPTVRRAVREHALFREGKGERNRDTEWNELVKGSVAGCKQQDAGEYLRKKSPFAASARRENSKRFDRGRIVEDGVESRSYNSKGAMNDAMDSSYQPILSTKARLLKQAQKVSADWHVCRTDREYETLARSFELVRYGADEKITAKGDVADFVGLVVAGSCYVVGTSKTTDKVIKKKLGPGTIIGEMGLLLGGDRKADVVASGRGTEDDVEGDGETFHSSLNSSKKQTQDSGDTLCVRIYFDAFVDFFAREPDLATRAFGSFANAATSRLKRWRLLEKAGKEAVEKESEDSSKEESETRKKQIESVTAKRVFHSLSQIINVENVFNLLSSESDKRGIAEVATVVDSNPYETIFASGTIASKFGIVLKGSVEAEQKHFGDDSGFLKTSGSFVGVVGFVDAFFKPHSRLSTATSGSNGSRIATFDAESLRALERKRPGVGTFLALALGRVATAKRNVTTNCSVTPHAVVINDPSTAINTSSDDLCNGTGDDSDADDACGSGDVCANSRENNTGDSFVADEMEMCFSPSTQLGRGQKVPQTIYSYEQTLIESAARAGSEPRILQKVVGALRVAFSSAAAEPPSVTQLAELAKNSRILTTDAGRQILRPNDRAVFVSVLISGSASVVDTEGNVSANLDSGAVIGENGLFGDQVVCSFDNGDANKGKGKDAPVQNLLTSSYNNSTSMIPPRFRKCAVVAGTDATQIAAWHVSDLINCSKGEGQVQDEENCEPATQHSVAVAFVMLCARSLTARVRANAARSAPRESFVSTLDFVESDVSDVSDVDEPLSDKLSDNVFPGNTVEDDDDMARCVEASDDEMRDDDSSDSDCSKALTPAQEKKRTRVVEKLVDALKPWRASIAEGTSEDDVAALAQVIAKDTKTNERVENSNFSPIVRFAPGDRVFEAGRVSCATLLIISGSIVVRDGGDAIEKHKPKKPLGSGNQSKTSGKTSQHYVCRAPGTFIGESEYFERSSGDDAFLSHGCGNAVRTIDAFACAEVGAAAVVMTHTALDRLRVVRPSLALAMFAKMASSAVVALLP